MTKAVLDIKQWGNNLGVRLPAAVAKAAHLRVDQRVLITVENGAVIIRPDVNNELSLAERLAQFDPLKHGGELLAAEPIGAEQW